MSLNLECRIYVLKFYMACKILKLYLKYSFNILCVDVNYLNSKGHATEFELFKKEQRSPLCYGACVFEHLWYTPT
jgi:hypothetical protein